MPKDPLCLLGFHPQVRWPTRCKRCFREYKEHAPREDTSRTSSLQTESTRARLNPPASPVPVVPPPPPVVTPPPTPIQPTLPTQTDDDVFEYQSRSRTSSVSSTTSSSSYVTAVDKDENKDFSTPYSSISSEALTRLKKYRGDEKKATDSDSFRVSQDPPVRRRRTTDLTKSEADGRSSDLSNSDSDSSRPGSRLSDRQRAVQTSSPNETVTIRLRKGNSFGDDVRESSSSPSLQKTPSPSPSPTPPLVPRFRLSSQDSESSGVDSGSSSSRKSTATESPAKSSSDSSEDVTTGSSAAKLKKPRKKRLLIQGVKEVTPQDAHDSDPDAAEGDSSSADVAFIIQVKSTRKKKKDDDDDMMSMTTTTDTTETTLVDVQENNSADGGISSWEFEEIKKEVDRLREKCDRVEKEKAEILSRRVANLEAPKAQSSEYLRLQQKVNQLTTTNEDLKDEQKHLETRVRELESELASRPSVEITQRQMADLRSKLTSTEAQIDQLHEEKRDVVLKMRDLEEEMEEMKDSYREQQSEEFAATKKELDYEQKNNRLLQFKLRKVEKRCDHLEAEKKELELRVDSSNSAAKISKLEEELAKSKSEIEKLLKETKKDKSGKDSNLLSPTTALKKKSPVLTKAPSGESVDPPLPPDFDPEQMLRDLQSTLERESDLREQLKFAEEEAQSLRQKISRIEEENESLLIQIKKMSAKSRTDLSQKGKVETGSFKDKDSSSQNGEKLDATDLKLQLEINEEQYKVVQRKVLELEDANQKLEKKLQQAEEKANTLESSTPFTKSKNVDEVSLLRRKLIEKERELERSQTELMTATKNKGKITRAKSLEIEESNKRMDTETKAELKKVTAELMKLKQESEIKKKDIEDDFAKAKKDLETHQLRASQMAESNKTLVGQIEKFKSEMIKMKDQYETIQDDFVIKNSQLSSEKEEIELNYVKVKKEHETIDKELKALRETFNDRQDTWIKEKLTMQEKLKEMEQSTKQLLSIPGDKDTQKLKHLLKEKSLDSDIRSRELESYKDQISQMQKENDALRRQLEDFDKVTQVQMRSLAHEPVRNDKELKELKDRLTTEEKLHKTEMAQLKMRKDQETALKNEEIASIVSQLSRAKRERDTFRQMVDSAQRAIAELKSRDRDGARDGSSLRRDSSLTSIEEAATGARAAVITLQDRVASLEDDLSESRRETSRSKTEFVTEKSSWEMKLGEMQQKINELEEEKLLGGSGRVRGSSALGRTRIELAWQKERDEQQRRLKEATTLARDLKNTLLEIERERDRERVEGRRRLEQMKGALEEEQEEMRRKVGESQGDLLELRDAHAKLRTANEKLRKDRERLESQREAQIKKELETRKVYQEREKILDQLLSKLNSSSNPTASTTSLSPTSKMSPTEILHYLQNIKALTEPEDLNNPKEKRRGAFKRASSLGDADGAEIPKSRESLVSMPASYGMKEHYGAAGRTQLNYLGSVSSSTLTLPSRGRAPGLHMGGRGNVSDFGAHSSVGFQAKGSLIRKAVSLEQTVAMPDEQKIWKGGSDAGSASSLVSQDGQFSRGSSVDRMSTISSKSEKPRSLVGKMKQFVKSKSIEETPTAERLVKAGVQAAGVASNAGSDLSLNSDYEQEREKEPGMKLKDKMKGMFTLKRSTRSPSVERKTPIPPPATLLPPQRPSRESTPKRDTAPPPSQSLQRPLMPMSSQRPLMPSSGMR